VERSLGLKHPTVSSILDRLEEKGFVCTAPMSSDRRYKRVCLTEKSLGMACAIQEKIDKIRQTACAGLTQAEQDQLSRMMKHMVENIGE
jgi:DNA-binding MarR family transcriptional regulator